MGNEPSDTEVLFLRDRDWSAIDAEPCRVTAFTPMAGIEDGKVKHFSKTLPYGSITFECAALPQEARGLGLVSE